MQVLCKTTEENAEAHCNICGQGFVMFLERESPSERAKALTEIHTALRRQHQTHRCGAVHPNGGFLVPEWNGSIAVSGTAIMGYAPTWAL